MIHGLDLLWPVQILRIYTVSTVEFPYNSVRNDVIREHERYIITRCTEQQSVEDRFSGRYKHTFNIMFSNSRHNEIIAETIGIRKNKR